MRSKILPFASKFDRFKLRDDAYKKESNGSTKNLEIFYTKISKKYDISIDELKKQNFEEKYKEIKLELDKTRVLGVNKNAFEKSITLVANMFRTLGRSLDALHNSLIAITRPLDGKDPREASYHTVTPKLGELKDDALNKINTAKLPKKTVKGRYKRKII